MADVFVGSVSVGVVPDARGWNDKLRAELVPSAGTIGDEIGRIMGQHIAGALGIGRDVSDSARRGEAETAAAGDRSGRAYASGFKTRFDAEMRGYHPEVRVRVKADTTAARAEIDSLGKGGVLARIAGLFTGAGGGSGVLGIPGKIVSAGANVGGAIGSALPAIGGEGSTAASVGGIAGGVVSIAALAAVTALVGQAIAGAVVAGFGAGILGLAGIGAILSGKLTKPFDDFKARAKSDLEDIGASFIPVIKSILSTASGVMGQLTPVFKTAAAIIAGPFKLFADTIITAFTQLAEKHPFRPSLRPLVRSFPPSRRTFPASCRASRIASLR